jgi:membrane protein DedA with SNARE-associated domain
MIANVLGAFIWATLYGVAIYSLGREVEELSGRMVMVFAIVTLVLIIVAVAFVRRHEAQLMTEAEKALPGPLQLL